MLADQSLVHIKGQFASLYQHAQHSTRRAVFIRHETADHLYCEVVLYFSPETSELAKAFDAKPCSMPAHEDLSIFVGDEDALTNLFSEIWSSSSMKPFSEQQIIESWKNNVTPWVKAIRAGEIASREQVTNQAIIDSVLKFNPVSVLDVGCGEGWLVRALEQQGISSCGIDAIPEFITAAQQQNVGQFQLLGYEDISEQSFADRFDALVCNFSLLGDTSVQHLFRMASTLLNASGIMIVQTLHPLVACEGADYHDGWRPGSWQGFSADFCDPAPWYFRTVESWQALFIEYGFQSVHIEEPINPNTQKPASIILSAQLK